MLGFDQFVDQRGGGGEPHPPLLPTGGDRQPREQVSLTGPALTYKNDRLGFHEIVAARKFVDLLSGDGGALAKVELLQRLHPRQMRVAQPSPHQPLLAVLEFGLQQRFQITQMGAPLARRLLSELGTLRSDARQMQRLALLADGGRFQDRSMRTHDGASWSSSSS